MFCVGDTLQLLPAARSPMTGVLPHCPCQRCRCSSAPVAVRSPRYMATERLHEPSAERARAESSPPLSPCPSQFSEDNQLRLRSDTSSSVSTSLCCYRDADYQQAEMMDNDGQLDDGAAAAARPTNKASTDFMAENDDRPYWVQLQQQGLEKTLFCDPTD